MPRNVRDLVLFVAGLLGMGFETIARKASDPTLVAAFLGMIGVPFILRRDEHNQETRDHDDHPPTKHPQHPQHPTAKSTSTGPTRQPVKRSRKETQ